MALDWWGDCPACPGSHSTYLYPDGLCIEHTERGPTKRGVSA